MRFKNIAHSAVFVLAVSAACADASYARADYEESASTRAPKKMQKSAPRKAISPQRVAFRFSVRRDKLASYKAWHRRVSPQLLRDLKNAGVSNYSIFLARDGQAFGYFEVKNFKVYETKMNASRANVAWQKIMKEYISTAPPAKLDPAAALEEVFHLN